MDDFRKYVREGKGRSDLTPLFRDSSVLRAAVQKMVDPFRAENIDKVIALDALGFIFGALASIELGVGLVLFRKGGKIPVEKRSIQFTDYSRSEKVFEAAFDSLKVGEKVIIVDEWSETGSQIKAAVSLAEEFGAIVIGVTCFNIDQVVREDPSLSKYDLRSVL